MLKLCPMCCGRPVNNPMARLANGPCDLCGGRGKVDTEKSCTCGRPAVYKLNEVDICTRYQCGKDVIEAAKART